MASDIVLPLQKVINLSLTQKKFANKWKIANVIPLYKGKGLVRTSPASYRPISLLPVTAKIVEKAVQFQLLEFMEKTSQFNYNNHAYRNNLSTTTTMLHLSDMICSATDTNQISVLMSVDESSAFDCVIHELLLRKLKMYNFDDSTCKWFQSYLSFRSQYVTIGAHKSNIAAVQYGVPQGSVLGPLLYTLYINELAETIKDDKCTNISHQEDDLLFTRNCIKCGALPTYADDATFLFSSNSRDLNQSKLTENLSKIKFFLNDHSLSMNEAKTTLLELMVRQKRVRINGTPPSILTKDEHNEDKLIVAGEQARLLGCNLHFNLSWRGMIETGEKAILPDPSQKTGRSQACRKDCSVQKQKNSSERFHFKHN